MNYEGTEGSIYAGFNKLKFKWHTKKKKFRQLRETLCMCVMFCLMKCTLLVNMVEYDAKNQLILFNLLSWSSLKICYDNVVLSISASFISNAEMFSSSSMAPRLSANCPFTLCIFHVVDRLCVRERSKSNIKNEITWFTYYTCPFANIFF